MESCGPTSHLVSIFRLGAAEGPRWTRSLLVLPWEGICNGESSLCRICVAFKETPCIRGFYWDSFHKMKIIEFISINWIQFNDISWCRLGSSAASSGRTTWAARPTTPSTWTPSPTRSLKRIWTIQTGRSWESSWLLLWYFLLQVVLWHRLCPPVLSDDQWQLLQVSPLLDQSHSHHHLLLRYIRSSHYKDLLETAKKKTGKSFAIPKLSSAKWFAEVHIV